MTMTRRDALAGSLLAATALVGVAPASAAAANSVGSETLPPPTHTAAEAGTASPTPAAEPVCLTDFEPLAQAKMSHLAWEYVNSAAADENTVRWNREAYQKIRIKPRILVGVDQLDTRVTLFGHEHAFPILLAPTAEQELTHPEGELATARGANAAETSFVLSSFSTKSIEDVAAVAKLPFWFQLYAQSDHEFTRHLVERAQAAGAKALCLTVDTPVAGARNREERIHFALPPGLTLPNLSGYKALGADNSGAHRPTGRDIFSKTLDAALSWKDVEWLRSFAKIPLLLKGVLNPDDAERAVQAGVAGLIVSNHGGRNLDTVPATIDALPLVAERVAGRIPVLCDGGIRRGTDVLKALALGANAVLIGRPYVYGLAVGGEAGVAKVLTILQREFQQAMALTGRTKVSEIDKSVIWG